MDQETPETVAVSPSDQTSDRQQSDSDQELNAESLTILQASAESVASSLEGLRRNSRTDRIIIITMSIVVIVVLVMLVILGFGEYRAAQQRELILSCTTPTGQCYKEGQARTAGAVKSIVDANAAVAAATAACSESHNGYVAIRACIDRTLK